MSIVVYWLEANSPSHELFASAELGKALALVEKLRHVGHKHVSISSELEDSVGKPGVDYVKPGYDWKKRRV